MSAFLDSMIAQAKSDVQTIVLPEGADPRTLEAARRAVDEGLAKVIVLGTADEIAAHGIALDGIEAIDPASDPRNDELADALFELRQAKGMTAEQARALVEGDVLYPGVMMVKLGMADGMVAGACHATGDVLRPALQILKTAPGTKLVSAFFVMNVPDCELGSNGTFLFADCALNQYPDAFLFETDWEEAEDGVLYYTNQERETRTWLIARDGRIFLLQNLFMGKSLGSVVYELNTAIVNGFISNSNS